jgi:hypothetical protein
MANALDVNSRITSARRRLAYAGVYGLKQMQQVLNKAERCAFMMAK